ncbi:hypothetical protein NE237_026328 [Protea cynaroides]|uniref:DNA-3-methyladenine glycosylase I n=1 Tax=Protea cynaroides TaxID=273540 RepID=A0A9Q0H7Z9_9MAGN|nr:hypothetical protein NE237_026328 [Protea cynaroides]
MLLAYRLRYCATAILGLFGYEENELLENFVLQWCLVGKWAVKINERFVVGNAVWNIGAARWGFWWINAVVGEWFSLAVEVTLNLFKVENPGDFRGEELRSEENRGLLLMSGARVMSMNIADSEVRPVLGPAGNKTRSTVTRKPATKPLRKVEKIPEVAVEEKRVPSPPVVASPTKLHSVNVPWVFRRQEQLLHSNLSLNASCSSDASSDSFVSRASTGRITRKSSTGSRRKQSVSKTERVVPDIDSVAPPDILQRKKRCAWVTPNTEPCYIAFHDEEWGLPVHDDRKLFELLVLSGSLAELTWPAILSKRHLFREVFLDFDPVAVSKLSEKKITAPGSAASSLLSELKLRAIIDNARQVCKIINEFGSFDKYIWGFVNHKPIVSNYRYARQVPVKTPKADVMSKDLVRRGFRSVGPTVIYSFMQVAGITNDHLLTCFRLLECIEAAAGTEMDGSEAKAEDMTGSEITRAVDELSISE